MEYFTLNNGNKIQNIQCAANATIKLRCIYGALMLSFTYQDRRKMYDG